MTLPLSYSRRSVLILPSLCYTRRVTDVPLLNAILFAAVGIGVFAAGFAIFVKALPFDVWREIVQEHNVAAAIVVGAIALGLGWIVATTMH